MLKNENNDNKLCNDYFAFQTNKLNLIKYYFVDYQKYESKNWKYLQSNCIILCVAFKYCPSKLYSNEKCLAMISQCASSDRVN